jgi:hypothetical protein
MIGLRTRFLANHSDMLRSSVEGGSDQDGPEVFAAALRSPPGEHTFIFIDDAETHRDAEIRLQGLTAGMKLYRSRMAPKKKDRSEVVLCPEKKFPASPQLASFVDPLPARSIAAYSRCHLEQNAAGIITE